MMSGTMAALVIVLVIGLIATYGITVGYFTSRVGYAAVFSGFVILATGFMYDVANAVATATSTMMSMF